MERKNMAGSDHGKRFGRFAAALGCAAMSMILVQGAAAQTAGPIKPPPMPPAAPVVKPPAPTTTTTGGTGNTSGQPTNKATLPPPTMPVEEMIKKFAAREDVMKDARGNYTYTQKILVKTYDELGVDCGQFQQTSDIVFTPEGKRFEKVTFAPQPTLTCLTMSTEDFKDIEDIQPFVLTTEELPKYNVTYVKHEGVDELNCYVFDVSPKQVDKNKAYFEGRIWVDDQTFSIVKSYGRSRHGIKVKKGEDGQLFPRFETIRENIAADNWFPTYTHADDILHFQTADRRIVMTIRYSNYKYFGSTIKIGTAPKQPDHEELREPPQP
jgi:hypothetical protein